MAHVASNTFAGAQSGQFRAIRQDGDSTERIRIDTCPVDCIHWWRLRILSR